MPRPRVRIRYRKLDDLRFVGHQDLVRTWDRWLRRAAIKLARTEGFHPRPRLNFPSALPVGIAGTDEVLELELADDVEPAALSAALDRHAPSGLSIVSIERMGDGVRFSQPATAVYELPLPTERAESVRERIAAWRATADPDLRPPTTILALDVTPEDVLRMELRLGEAGAVRPRDLLAKLELTDLETVGGVRIVRTRVGLHVAAAPNSTNAGGATTAGAANAGPTLDAENSALCETAAEIFETTEGEPLAAAETSSAVSDSSSETT